MMRSKHAQTSLCVPPGVCLIRPAILFLISIIFIIPLFSCAAFSATKNKPPSPLEFIDFHSHVFRSDQNVEEVLGFMKTNRIRTIVLSGYPYLNRSRVDDVVGDLALQRPDAIIPFLRGFPLSVPESEDYVRKNLDSGTFRGVGELIITGHGTALRGDGEIPMAIFRIAGEYKAPVLVHWTIGSNNRDELGQPVNLQQLLNALRGNRSTTFILAHCGAGPPPQKDNFGRMLDALLKDNSNLYMDIAGMHDLLMTPDFKPTELGTTILSVMRRYPDRFLVGFDVGDDEHPFNTKFDYARVYSAFLSHLTRAAAKKAAFRNAEKILHIGSSY